MTDAKKNWLRALSALSNSGYLIVSVGNGANNEYVKLYKYKSSTSFTYLDNFSSDVTNTTNRGLDWSSDNKYLAIGFSDNTNNTCIYEVEGDTFTKLTGLVPANTSYVYDIKWSPDDEHLALGSQNSPYLHIYKRTGSTFSKLSTPNAGLYPYSIDYSDDGQYLHFVRRVNISTNYFYQYKRVGDTYTDLGRITSAASEAQSITSRGNLVILCTTNMGLQVFSRTGDVLTLHASYNTGYNYLISSFNKDGTLLAAIGNDGAGNNFCRIFSVSGTTLTFVTDLGPQFNATNTPRDVHWSSDDSILAVCTYVTAGQGENAVTLFDVSGTTFTKIEPSPVSIIDTNTYGLRFSN